jgi:hypothetical protein
MAGDPSKGSCVLRHVVSPVGEFIDGKFKRYLDYKDGRLRRRCLGISWVLILIKKAIIK